MKNICNDVDTPPKPQDKKPGKKNDAARSKALRANLLKRKEQLAKRQEDPGDANKKNYPQAPAETLDLKK